MQLIGKLVIVTAAAVAVAICLLTLVTPRIEAADSVTIEKQMSPGGFGEFKLPKMFDFDYYKERFGKRYASMQENLARKAYFVARALRAFVSGMNYKWRRSNYYLAINHLSDSSPQELEGRRNKVLMAQSHAAGREINKSVAQVRESNDDELPAFLPANVENLEEILRNVAEAHPNEPGYRELLEASGAVESREKRSTGSKKPRDFSLDQLMKPGVHEPARERAEVAAKIANDVQSNNPYYEQPEVLTRGLYDNQEAVLIWRAKTIDTRPVEPELKSSLKGLSQWVYTSLFNKQANEDDVQEEEDLDYKQDVMYFDHRDSHCLLEPRDQGNCGACYAFSAISYMEWLYCTKNGKIIRFSEQYMIDCGKGRYGDEMDGCEGSSDYEVFKFIQNFGMERMRHYPYMQREGQCPYADHLDIKQTGYIRMELNNGVAIPVSLWGEYIKYGPLYTGIATPTDYSEYSGGVHDGHNCDKEPDHAQLLVGHGREDGKDFWLFRNSYGANWGDGGYFKLSKDAPDRCIEHQTGYALGSKNGIDYTVSAYKNSNNINLHSGNHKKYGRQAR